MSSKRALREGAAVVMFACGAWASDLPADPGLPVPPGLSPSHRIPVKAPLVPLQTTPTAASAAVHRMLGSLGVAGAETEVTPRVRELARGLRDDPRLMYEYVRNNVGFVPYFGVKKGANMTLLDGAGGSFDQSALLVAMLRSAGYGASFVYGTLSVSAAPVANWLGVWTNADVVSQVLAQGGIPANVYTSGGNLHHVDLTHVWVRAVIGGTAYDFDPSLKSHAIAAPQLDLPAAMGYDRAAFLGHATSGMVSTPEYVQGVNRVLIRADLAACAANLAGHLRRNLPAASLADALGDKRIEPQYDAPLLTSLPGHTAGSTWTNVPDGYHSWLRLVYFQGISTDPADQQFDVSIPSCQVYGKRFTLVHESSKPVLRLDGSALATGATANWYYNILVFDVDHPYPAMGGTLYDEQGYAYVKGNAGTYFIQNGWGGTGRRSLEARRQALADQILAGAAEASEPRLGETLAVMGLAWLAGSWEASRLGDLIGRTVTLSHHEIGLCGQDGGTSAPFFDLPLSRAAVVSAQGDLAAEDNRFQVRSGVDSAFEWGALDQMQTRTAVSTVRLVDLAVEQGLKIFDATNGNYYGNIRTNLAGYGTGLGTIDSYIDSGDRLLLPQRGDLQVGRYTGAGYIALRNGGTSYMILGRLSGGQCTEFGLAQSGQAEQGQKKKDDQLHKHPKGGDPVDLASGGFLLGETDLVLGGGALPFGLSFERSYHSAARRETGTLGPGWSHNWSYAAVSNSDTFLGCGERSPQDAAAAIAALYVAADLLEGGLGRDRLVMATVCNRWLMENLVDNVVNVSEPSGTYPFVRRPDGAYQPPPDVPATLTPRAGGGWWLRSVHGESSEFGSDGRLIRTTDRNGNCVALAYTNGRLAGVTNGMGRGLAFAYDASNRLETVSDSAGRQTVLAYDGAGRLAQARAPDGGVTRYVYDATGRLAQVFRPAFPAQPSVSNTYDTIDRLDTQLNPLGRPHVFRFGGDRVEEVDAAGSTNVTYLDARGQRSRVVDGRGQTHRYEYDGLGRTARHVWPEGNGEDFGYDEFGNLSVVTNRPKPGWPEPPAVWRFAYETNFQLLVRSTDPLGRVTSNLYDAAGNLVGLRRPEVGGRVPKVTYVPNARGQVREIVDAEGIRTVFRYDPGSGEPTGVTKDAGGRALETTYEYDAAGDVTRRLTPGGQDARFGYDASRRLTNRLTLHPYPAATAWIHDAQGNVTETTRQVDPAGLQWQTERSAYNAGNRPVTNFDACGRAHVFEYDDAGRVGRAINPAGEFTQHRYEARGRIWRILDSAGRTVEERTYTANGYPASVVDGEGRTTRYVYDGFDRLAMVIAPGARTNAYAYEALGPEGRLTASVDPAGGQAQYEYDALGRLTRAVDADGTQHRRGYDLNGRLLWLQYPSGRTERFGYDGSGNLVARTNAAGQVWRFAYDDDGRVIRATDPAGGSEGYGYDLLGRRVSATDAVGRVTRWEHDAIGQVTNVVLGDGTSTRLDYDACGRLVGLTDGRGQSRTFGYDDAGRLCTNRNPKGDTDVFAYDGAGRLARHTSPDGKVTALAYDLAGRLTNAVLPDAMGERSHVFDAAGNLVQATDAGGSERWEYDRAGRKVAFTNRHGQAVAFGHTPGGRPAWIRYPGGRLQTFVHDAAGRLLSATDWTGRQVTNAYDALDRPVRVGLPNGALRMLGYDALGRTTFLRDERGDGTLLFEASYARDASGRIVRRTLDTAGVAGALPGGQRTLTYDAANRTVREIDGGVTNAFAYDARGNLLSRSRAGQTTHFRYDGLNRLIGSSNAAGVVSYVHDALGHRAAMWTSGGTNRYVADDGRLFARTDGGGALEFCTVRVGPVFYRVDALGTVHVLHGDERGNVIAVTDGGQVVRQSYAYDAFGRVVASAGTVSNEFQWAGVHGASTDPNGLVHLGRRFYEPAAGRFLTEDPLGIEAGPNLYLYGAADPVNRIDPGGLETYYPEAYGETYEPHPEYDPDIVGISGGFTMGPVSVGGGISIDRYGRVYVSLYDGTDPDFRGWKLKPSLSFSATGSYVLRPGDLCRWSDGPPTPEEISNFYPGFGRSYGFGFGPYGGISQNPSGTSVDLGVGFGVNLSESRTWECLDFSDPLNKPIINGKGIDDLLHYVFTDPNELRLELGYDVFVDPQTHQVVSYGDIQHSNQRGQVYSSDNTEAWMGKTFRHDGTFYDPEKETGLGTMLRNAEDWVRGSP